MRHVILGGLMLAAACAGDDAQTEAQGSTTSTTTEPTTTSATLLEADPATTAEASTSTSVQESTTTVTVAEDLELPDEIERTDWLTLANGLVVVSFSGDAVSASTGVRAVDGAHNQIGFGNDGSSPSVYTFELPAETVFDRFVVPDTRNSPGNTTFFGSIEIAGSNAGATEGFDVLVAADFAELAEDEELAEFVPAVDIPVKWVRLTLSGALQVEPEHGSGNTVVRFTEVVGNGVQETVPLSETFTGVWELRFADNPNGSGHLTELKQQGAVVTGCIGFAEVDGTVTGNVLRLNGIDTRDQTPSVYILSTDAAGELRGVESTRNGVFRARVGPIAADGTATPCSDVAVEPLACGSIVYVNFDVNSAVIRPDSLPIVDDLFAGLQDSIGDEQVAIVGHTSTEGATDYNQDLSERRAQAVLDALVSRGLDPTQFAAEGRGETEPLVSESDEASRSINRRVEVACT